MSNLVRAGECPTQKRQAASPGRKKPGERNTHEPLSEKTSQRTKPSLWGRGRDKEHRPGEVVVADVTAAPKPLRG